MTIKELYEEAIRYRREDWTIIVYDYSGFTDCECSIEWKEDEKEVFIFS